MGAEDRVLTQRAQPLGILHLPEGGFVAGLWHFAERAGLLPAA